MIDVLDGTLLTGLLLVLSEHGWQSQLLEMMLEQKLGRLGHGHPGSPGHIGGTAVLAEFEDYLGNVGSYITQHSNSSPNLHEARQGSERWWCSVFS
jgi:hypothetical protein